MKKRAKQQDPPKGKKGQTKGGTSTVTGSNKSIGVYKTTKQRTTSGGVAQPYKYKTESIDTSGYSKGRQNFSLKTVEGEADKTGLNKVTKKTSKNINRKDVPSTLKKLK